MESATIPSTFAQMPSRPRARGRLTRALSLGIALLGLTANALASRPNVLFIVSDDLNNYVGYLGGHPQAHTPALDTLAATGTAFPLAYCNNPICAPSRASLLTGIYPHVSRNFFWEPWHENGVLANSRTIMEHFRYGGYTVAGTGKLMHHSKAGIWPEFGPAANAGPYAWDGTEAVAHPSVPEPFRSAGAVDGGMAPLSDLPFNGQPGTGWSHSNTNFVPFHYATEADRDQLPDEAYATWAVDRLQQHAAAVATNPDTAPLFLAVGFIRPHTPLYAPRSYFDKFPLESVQLPVILNQDASDTFYDGIIPAEAKGIRYFQDLAAAYGSTEDGLRRYIQAYLACVAFVDDQIGTVLSALEDTGLADNTIVIVTSDHGYMMGEKDYLFKDAPWEQCAQVPLIIRAPGVSTAGGRPAAPVSLIDLYPTLVDLCGLPAETRKNGSGAPLDGHSLRPLLIDPESADWTGPDTALTMVHAVDTPASPLPSNAHRDVFSMHYSLRSREFRYIRYNNGTEELYDHRSDPREWVNVAADPAMEEPMEWFRSRLASILPDYPWTDPGDIVSIRFMERPPPAYVDQFEVMGLQHVGTRVGNWNRVHVQATLLRRGNGTLAFLPLSASFAADGTAYGPIGFAISNLGSTFPDGYWAIVYFADPATDPAGLGDGYRILGDPSAPLRNDLFSYTAPPGMAVTGLQLVSGDTVGQTWHGFPITQTGYINTGTGFLSWLWVGEDGAGLADWRYSVRLGQWLFLPHSYLRKGWGAWTYLSEAAAFNADELTGSWYKSLVLDTWVLSFAPAITSGPGWVYVTDMSY
jgi:arylsulfatase A-like enzyme